MFMQKIRKSTQKNRTILIIVVAVLTVGLVGSFAVWNSDDYSQETGQVSITDRIAAYENNIAENAPAEGEDVDFSKAASMGNLYDELRTLYYQAAMEVYSTDSDQADAYYAKSVDAAAKAAEFYQIKWDKADENLNAYGRAQILGKRAVALSYTGDNETARELYLQALELSPENAEVATNYVAFIYGTDGIDAAQAYADSYMAMFEEGSEQYVQMQQAIAYYQSMEEFYAQLSELQNEENSDGTADDGTADDGTADDGTADDGTADSEEKTE